MKLAFAVVIVLLLFGCAAPPEEQKTSNETHEAAEEITEEEPQEIQEPEIVQNESPEANANETVDPEEMVFDFNKTTENGTLIVYFFHNPGCSACKGVYPFMDEARDRHPEVIFIGYSTAEPSGKEAYKQFVEHLDLNKSQQYIPQVYVNGTIITDRFKIEERLEPIIQNFSK